MEPIIKLIEFVISTVKLIWPYCIVFVVGYFITAFVCLEPNPLEWDKGTRLGYVFIFGFFQFIEIAVYLDITGNK